MILQLVSGLLILFSIVVCYSGAHRSAAAGAQPTPERRPGARGLVSQRGLQAPRHHHLVEGRQASKLPFQSHGQCYNQRTASLSTLKIVYFTTRAEIGGFQAWYREKERLGGKGDKWFFSQSEFFVDCGWTVRKLQFNINNRGKNVSSPH